MTRPAMLERTRTGGLQGLLDLYATHSAMTDPGRHAARLDALPDDPAALVRVVQGLMLYEHVAADFYGVDMPDARRQESHIRGVERMLDTLLALDGRPLDQAREPGKRLVGICRNFAVIAIAMLRAKGVPARLRGGFGTYFNPGYFEDHWVCEYWDRQRQRWALADPQFDDVWVERFRLGHDIMDVPRDRFITAGQAWRACRSGEADPGRFGICFSGLRGLWFVAGCLVRDLAALNKAEMLPWDVWGAQPAAGWVPGADELAFFDRLAALTERPDDSFHGWSALYATDDRLRVPPTVFNALRQREEAATAA